MNFGALSRGFGTCCLRFKNGVATIPAKLASGWLARLYREGVEPSGLLQKVSDHIPILLFWICPGAREVSWRPQAVPRGQRIMPLRLPQRLCAQPTAAAARTLKTTSAFRGAADIDRRPALIVFDATDPKRTLICRYGSISIVGVRAQPQARGEVKRREFLSTRRACDTRTDQSPFASNGNRGREVKCSMRGVQSRRYR